MTGCIRTTNPSQSRFPYRMIRNEKTGLATTRYRWEIYRGWQCPPGHVAIFRHPSFIYTNGTAFFRDINIPEQGGQGGQNRLLPKEYKCIDRYVDIDTGTTDDNPAALICEKIKFEEQQDSPKVRVI